MLPRLTTVQPQRKFQIYQIILFSAKLPPLTHSVEGTTRKGNTVKPNRSPIQPTPVPHGKLDFALPKATKEDDICVYSMQAYPLQQPLNPSKGEVSDKISESSDLIPPRILQSVHGYVDLRHDYPTRLNLSASWDKDAVRTEISLLIFESFFMLCIFAQPRTNAKLGSLGVVGPGTSDTTKLIDPRKNLLYWGPEGTKWELGIAYFWLGVH